MTHYTIHLTPEFNDTSQIGWAIEHKDGTITAHLGAIPLNHQILLVPIKQKEPQTVELKVA